MPRWEKNLTQFVCICLC